MNRKTFAASALVGLFATSAAGQASAADWLVYTQASASAYSDSGYQEIINTECNGTRANPTYCGPVLISATKTDASQSASVTEYPNPLVNSGLGIEHGDGFASADLATGELKIVTDATGSRVDGESTRGGAYAEFFDTLHFDLGSNLGLVPVTVDIGLDGRTFGYVQPGFGFVVETAYSQLVASFQWYGLGVTCTNAALESGCDSQAQLRTLENIGDWSTFAPDQLVGTFLVDASHPDVTISMSISAGGSTEYGDTFTKFGDTAALQLQLPQGVTYTSDSGVFLSAAPAGGVPAPASWSLLFLGVGCVGAALRRRPAIRAV